MKQFFIEEFYHFLQGVLIFQLIFFVLVYIIANRKEVGYYCLYLLFTILYFFINAPKTFFGVNDDLVFNSSWYVIVNYIMLIGSIYSYIQFINAIFFDKKTPLFNSIVKYSTITILAFIVLFLTLPLFDYPRAFVFYFTHLLTLPIGIFIFYKTNSDDTLSIRLLRVGIIINIICNVITLIMIVRYNSGTKIYAFDEYPLLFMRIGILIDIFFFQLVLLRKWHEQERSLKTKDIESKLEIEKLRNEISRELHDDVGTSLSKISLQAYMVSNIVKDNKEVLSYINSISKESKNIITNLKHIVHSFKSEDSNYDLKTRITDFISNLTQEGKTQIEFLHGELNQAQNIDLAFNHNVYMIVKEGISNAIKYSNGTQILLRLNSQELIIKDNGKGFDSRESHKGNGLNNIKKRCEVIKAIFQIQSSNDGGTKLFIKFSNPSSSSPV